MHDQLFEGLFGRQQPDRAQEIGLLRRQLRIERTPQIAVVESLADRVVLFDRQMEHRRHETAYGGAADDEGLLRHDVEAVARIVVASFEVEQLLGHARTVVTASHEDDDLFGAEPSVDRLLDPFDQRRLFGEGLDANVPFVAALLAGPLRMCAVSVGERASQLCGDRGGDSSLFDPFVERTAQGRAVRLHDAVDNKIVEVDDTAQTAPVLFERFHLDVVRPQRLDGAAVENVPVSAPPAVDRLLDVTHQKHRRLFALRHGVVQQR